MTVAKIAEVIKALKPAKKSNPNIVKIDSRAATYEGAPVRILAVTSSDDGKIFIKKEDTWGDQPVRDSKTTVVTDTPHVFKHWSLSFDEKSQMQTVLAAYKAVKAAGMLKLDDSLMRYDPTNVIQTRKIDERGKVLEFDSMGINNGHVAILLAVWAARMAYGGYIMTREPDDADNDDDDGFSMMPFSI